MPQKHDKYTRKVFDGIGEGWGGGGGCKSDYKDCFRSQKCRGLGQNYIMFLLKKELFPSLLQKHSILNEVYDLYNFQSSFELPIISC